MSFRFLVWFPARWPRWLCEWLKHPGGFWLMDETGEFLVQDCPGCRSMVIRDMVGGHTQSDYEAVLDRWLVDWEHDK